MTKHELILDFIKQFRDLGAEKCFSNGMCWYFTVILQSRFGDNSEVVYDPIVNHFATEIDGHIYDITGDISLDPQYHWEYWPIYSRLDAAERSRIYRDCIYKVPADARLCVTCGDCFRDDWGTDVCARDGSAVDFYNICQQ